MTGAFADSQRQIAPVEISESLSPVLSPQKGIDNSNTFLLK
jgi:hypothetical protein